MTHSHGHVCESEADQHDHDHSPPPEDTNEVQSLFSKIRLNAVRALNAVNPDAGGQVIKPWNKRFTSAPSLVSDVDEQLIVHVPFEGQVKLKSILIRCPNTTSAIKHMKVFINQEDLDFDNVADAKATETFECVAYESAANLVEYPVKVRLYNNVKSVTLYLEQNWSDASEQTKIWYLGFRGEHTEVKSAPVAITYEAFANPKDHKVKGFTETAGRFCM